MEAQKDSLSCQPLPVHLPLDSAALLWLSTLLDLAAALPAPGERGEPRGGVVEDDAGGEEAMRWYSFLQDPSPPAVQQERVSHTPITVSFPMNWSCLWLQKLIILFLLQYTPL
jgi:hypothetical protein